MRKAALPLMLALSACVAGQPEARLQGHAEGGQPGYVAPLLNAARRDFFGADTGLPGSGGEGGFGLAEPVRFSGATPTAIALDLAWEVPAGLDGWRVSPRLKLGHQRAHAFLPEGLGVFTDPMTISMSASALTASLTLNRSLPLGPDWTLDYGAGLGLMGGVGRGHFSSALIDLRSQTRYSRSFLSAEAGLQNARGAGLFGQVLYYGPDAAEYRLGLTQRF